MVEQLAGDLLPDATADTVLATAFHRNTQINDEGGTDDEEYRIAAVQDRLATTSVALNGFTMNCVQCHSHPYDPVRHGEYFSLLAFFNTTRDADYTDDYPTRLVPADSARATEVFRMENELAQLRREGAARDCALAAESTGWAPRALQTATATPKVTFEVRAGEVFTIGTVPVKAAFEFTTEAFAGEITALRVEVPSLDPVKARHTPELGFIITKLEASVVAADGTVQPVDFGYYAHDTEHAPTEMAARPEANDDDANAAAPEETHESWLAANPSLFTTRWLIAVPRAPLRLAEGSRLRLQLKHGRAITNKPAPPRRLRVATSTDPRWSALAADAEQAAKISRAKTLATQLKAIPGAQVPVMSEQPGIERRETHVFARGNWLEKEGEPLVPAVPALFPEFPAGAPRDRLGLARWYFQPDQPLTARVAVNRYWEQLFGLGLVETLEDFGSAGLPPSHPELLDWLALHFQGELKWDVKALLRELVLSATYRQEARASAALREKDPRNRLLARGPRNRLTAEMVRDQALLASGLLSRKLHGPPVMPPQPVGVWATVYSNRNWTDATGEDRYRRAIYTYWKRSSPYPSFLTFDAPTRDLCSPRRLPTNTPLQALVTLNDPVYHEAARALAVQMQTLGGEDPAAQIAYAFRATLARDPVPAESVVLLRLRADAEGEAGAMGALVAVAEAVLNLDATLTK